MKKGQNGSVSVIEANREKLPFARYKVTKIWPIDCDNKLCYVNS